MAKVLIVGNDSLEAAILGARLKNTSHEMVYTTVSSARYNYRENQDVKLVVLADDSPRTLSAYHALRNEESEEVERYEGPFLVLSQTSTVTFSNPEEVCDVFPLKPQELPYFAEAVDRLITINERLRLQYPTTEPDSPIQQPTH